jgi:hypothetical protein
MSEEPHADGREPFDSREHDSLHQDLPFGMAGVTSMLERLRAGVEGREAGASYGWTHGRARAVADYLISLHPEYWMSGEELAYCRRIAAN